MADYPNTDPREAARLRAAEPPYRTAEPSAGSGLLFIVGGLVVAVGFIIWLVADNNRAASDVVPVGTTNSVTIENTPPAAPDATTPVVPPASETVIPPAEGEPVTPDGTTTTPPAQPAPGTP
jgi:hypothetical protein